MQEIQVEGISIPELFQRIQAPRSSALWIVTANPEILLETYRDESYAHVIRQADVRTVDGFGLWLLLRMFGQKTKRVTGIDLSYELIKEAAEHQRRVALIGGDKEDTAQKAATFLKKEFPSLTIATEFGGIVDRDGKDDQAGEEARHRLTMFAPDILLVAFGHPKQERWILNYVNDFPKLKVVMGVGGTFEIWAGNIRRAPRWLQAIGLEWAWRLILEPKRWKRIWNAVVVFPVYFIWKQIF